MSLRKICVVTGTRAEYGLLYWLLKELQADQEIDVQLVVTGSHLSEKFGLTYKEIESDGFEISEKVEILSDSDSKVGMAESLSLAVKGFTQALSSLKPDIIVVLGDRYEILAVASAALLLGVPVAHIQGGDLTEGATDESIRHAITKLSQIHFPATDHGRKLVSQMGENPQSIFNFGSLSAESVKRTKLRTQGELEEILGIKFGSKTFLGTYHPLTTSMEPPRQAIERFLEALDQFPDATIILTKPGADAGGLEITKLLEDYVRKNQGRVFLKDSLGRVNYLSALQCAHLMIGNSSSGILEAPLFKKPSVNIGLRQQGRLRSSSVIDCNDDVQSIASAIKKALSLDFQKTLSSVQSPYAQNDTSKRIKEKLKSIKLAGLQVKKFFEIGSGR